MNAPHPKRIGILGGTFDPIHTGHLIIADQVCTRLGLEQMIFVPAGEPPHKRGKQITSPEQRFEMVRLATAGNEYFALSRLDINRAGPCYTVDTVRLFQDAWGAEAEIYFLIGGDSLTELPTWRQPEKLLRLCHLVAVERTGYKANLHELERLFPGLIHLIHLTNIPLLDISATEIRQRVCEKKSIRYLVPPLVEQYIYEHRLYR